MGNIYLTPSSQVSRWVEPLSDYYRSGLSKSHDYVDYSSAMRFNLEHRKFGSIWNEVCNHV